MKKSEFIERYGIEAYKAHNERNKERNKERYANNAQYRKAHNEHVNEHNKARYANDAQYRKAHKECSKECKKVRYVKDGRIDLIENYELAKADNFTGWLIHHRLELTINGEFAHTPSNLKRLNMYYNRPPCELIWLRHGEHSRMHRLAEWRK